MQRTPMYEEKQILQFALPWHANTAKGFGVGVSTVLILLLLIGFSVSEEDIPPTTPNRAIELTQLSFGPGDGTGARKGNLTAEGAKHKGVSPKTSLSDAEDAGNTVKSKTSAPTDASESDNIKGVKEIPSEQGSNKGLGASSQNVGAADGSLTGTGLGSKGTGKGLGEGLGDIDWGGGGNRTLINKVVPKYPPGVNIGATIKIRFIVRQDGTVSSMIPLQKGDPRLEKAAMDALKQWRFNPLKENKEMVGIIPFTFKLK